MIAAPRQAPKTIPLLGPNAERWSYDPHFQCLDAAEAGNSDGKSLGCGKYGCFTMFYNVLYGSYLIFDIRDWLVVGTWIVFSIKYWVANHPNWRTHIFQRGGPTTNQEMLKMWQLLNLTDRSLVATILYNVMTVMTNFSAKRRHRETPHVCFLAMRSFENWLLSCWRYNYRSQPLIFHWRPSSWNPMFFWLNLNECSAVGFPSLAFVNKKQENRILWLDNGDIHML